MSSSSRTTALGRIRPRAHLAAAAGAVIAAIMLLLLAPMASAESSDPYLLVRSVTAGTPDNRAATTLGVVYTGNESDLNGAKLLENGNEVQLSTPAPNRSPQGIVFVIDTGPGASDSATLTSARQQISKSVAAHPGARYGIVQAGDKAEIKLEFTADVNRVKTVLDPSAPAGCVPSANETCKPTSSIGPTKSAAVWQALSLAGGMFEGSTLQPTVVLVNADNSTGDDAAVAVGKTSIISHGAAFWSIAYTGAGLDPTPYSDLVASTGGQSLVTDNDQSVSGLIDSSVNTITKQNFVMTYNTSVPAGQPINLELTVGNQTVTADAISGGGLVQGNALHPQIGSTARTLPFVDNQLALIVALGLAALAVAGIAYAFTLVFVKDDLSNVLSPYADAYELEEADENASALGKSALIKRAVALTEQVAEQQGLLTRAEAALERANLPLRAGEALFLYVVIVIASALIPLLLWRNLVPVLLFGVIGVLLPPAVVNFIAKRRRKAFMSQLPDTLSLLSGTLRAGYSLMQGVEAVSQEVDEPMGLELRRVVTESRLGRPLEESLESSADRMDSPDFAWAVMAIRIQREVGGNLAELLMTVADTMVARERLRRDVAALTAEGRVSAVILGGLPPALGLIMFVLNPEYTSVLFKDGLGIAMVIAAVVSMVVGFLWMRKIINIEI